MKSGLDFKDFFTKMSEGDGAFEDHIAKSIPGYTEMTYETARIITELYPNGADILDIGSSEGYWGDAVINLNQCVRVHSLDPNPKMREVFINKHIDGSHSQRNTLLSVAFGDGFYDGERNIPSYKPIDKYDVVRESMTFQFIDKDRRAQYRLVKRALKRDGIFITNSKNFLWNEAEYREYESYKDYYKQQFFSGEQIRQKKETIIANMEQYMVQLDETIAALQENFTWVAQYWVSGNFHGFVASESAGRVARFLDMTHNARFDNTVPGRLLTINETNKR